MRRKVTQLVAAIVLMAGIAIVAAPVTNTYAQVSVCPAGAPADSPVCQSQDDEATTLVQDIVNILLFIVGIISVIMIIIGGIMYTVSGGDGGAVTKAKNTILYAVIGLVVAILAFAIVNFVIARFA